MRARCHSGLKPFAPALLAVLSLAAGLTACGGSGGDVGPGDAVVASVTIAPAGLTLTVGGQGSLTADVRNAAGDLLTDAAVAWSSRNDLVASVAGNGTVSGNSVGVTQVIAASGEKADTVDVIVVQGLTLEVVPAAASVAVGGTVQFEVVARDGSGQVVAPPPVTWASSNTAVATIDGTGLATGVAPGQTGITASAGTVTSSPATLTVTNEQAAACDGIASVAGFDGSLDYDYVTSGDTDGGFQIQSQNHGRLTAKLTRAVPGGPIFETWQGQLEGTASIQETRTDPSTGTTDRLDGGGPIVPSIGGSVFQSVMSLIVNVTTCTYMLTVNPAIRVTRFEFGTRREADELVAQVQIGRANPLGAWKFLGSIAQPGYNIEAHPVAWAAEHVDRDAFSPLGYANELFGSDPEAPVGEATVSYILIPK